jgi:toxin-antitoxin system PIN domain toxin
MRSEVYLLDSNVLIALSTPDHTAHQTAIAWFRTDQAFATCPITQGALLRFHLRWAVPPSVYAAKELLRRIYALPSHHFWPDDVSYLQIPEAGVMGYRQLTDAYLVSLAAAHGGRLATLDEALAAVHPTALLIR